jgi:hypothetical protein
MLMNRPVRSGPIQTIPSGVPLRFNECQIADSLIDLFRTVYRLSGSNPRKNAVLSGLATTRELNDVEVLSAISTRRRLYGPVDLTAFNPSRLALVYFGEQTRAYTRILV